MEILQRNSSLDPPVLAENDAKEPAEHKLTAEKDKEKIKALRERMKKVHGHADEGELGLTDPDSRSLPLAGGPEPS
ncbi:MAG: hypothetical protein IIC78_14390 [Chloroflexi bacterium]|nr:hypothetical protein [Chloroflexota bacterium]